MEWNGTLKWTIYIALNEIRFSQHLFHMKCIHGTFEELFGNALQIMYYLLIANVTNSHQAGKPFPYVAA